MNKERLMTVLLAPRISEKAIQLRDLNQYTFKVRVDATKYEIASAVEELFNVKVAKVRVCNFLGKQRRFGKVMGRKKDWKKAYVTLQDNQKIDLGVA